MKKILSILLLSLPALLFAQEVAVDSVATATHDTILKNPTTGGKLICLTFDDGPNTKSTPKILKTLKKYGVPATFFATGHHFSSETAKLMQQGVAQGCDYENHTWTHPQMTKLSTEQRLKEVNRTNAEIKRITGRDPIFFRPPYLNVDSTVRRDIDMVFITGIGAHDWVTSNSPQRIVKNVLDQAYDGAIVILHDLGANVRTPVALETLIPELIKRGYRMVTVEQLFKERGVTPVRHKSYNKVAPKGAKAPAKKKK